MKIAFCYESVLPARGGCETYIADLSRRLLADRHEVHLYACRWDAKALPPEMKFHQLPAMHGPRFLRPWRFGRACLQALRENPHDVSVGFDKTWGQDVLYPQGGLHAASVEYNQRKHASPWLRRLAGLGRLFEPAHWSFALLERRQYLRDDAPLIVVNSHMVRQHFLRFYHIAPGQLHVVRSSINPDRFPEQDRPRLRQEWRTRWNLNPQGCVALFAAMNYRLKGLDPLLRSVARMLARPELKDQAPAFELLVVGNPETRRYQKLAQQLGIAPHVRFVGHCPEMRNAYFAADFLVHPTFYDPCSLVVLEALGCGLPIITTRYNGASELLQNHDAGFVVDDPHDHQHLGWCLAQMLDSAGRQARAQAARRAAAQWTFEQHYRQLLAVFQLASTRRLAAAG